MNVGRPRLGKVRIATYVPPVIRAAVLTLSVKRRRSLSETMQHLLETHPDLKKMIDDERPNEKIETAVA